MLQNTLTPPPPKKVPSQLTFLFKPNAAMNNHDIRRHNNERNHLDSYFYFLKSLLVAFKFIYSLKIIQLMKALIHIWVQYRYTSLHLNYLR